MAKLPYIPGLVSALWIAKEKECLSEFALVSASLDYKNPIDFQRRSEFLSKGFPNSDLYALLTAYNRAADIHFISSECKKIGVHGLRFREIAESARLLCVSLGEKFKPPRETIECLSEILLKVYPDKLAYLENKGTNAYRDFTGLTLHLAKDSTARGSQWVLPLKVLERKNKSKIILEMDEVTTIEEGQIRNSE